MSDPENASENTYDLAVSEHRGDNSVELDSGSGGGNVTESLNVRGTPEEVRVIVQSASGNYSVDVNFNNTSVSLQDAASTDLEVSQDVFSNSTVDVVFSDDSGVSNTIDYDIYLL